MFHHFKPQTFAPFTPHQAEVLIPEPKIPDYFGKIPNQCLLPKKKHHGDWVFTPLGHLQSHECSPQSSHAIQGHVLSWDVPRLFENKTELVQGCPSYSVLPARLEYGINRLMSPYLRDLSLMLQSLLQFWSGLWVPKHLAS